MRGHGKSIQLKAEPQTRLLAWMRQQKWSWTTGEEVRNIYKKTNHIIMQSYVQSYVRPSVGAFFENPHLMSHGDVIIFY